MDLLSLLKSYAGIVASVVSALFGGSVLKAYQAYQEGQRAEEEQDHTQAMEWSERLEGRLSQVETRLDNAESELRTTKQQLTKSRIRRERLSAAIDSLIERIDRLIERLAEHERVTEDEREDLLSIPHVEGSKEQ